MSAISDQVDVLVVGAGPTGLVAALELARAGLEVEIVDRAWRAAAQSYACGLHAATVELLSRLGLQKPILDAGTRVEGVSFYEGDQRRAAIQMGRLGTSFPYLLVLPQDHLEEILEEQLRMHKVRVRWGYRLDDVSQDENAVVATVEKLGITSLGYPFARSEETVEKEIQIRARFLVAADGAASHVRSVLGIDMERFGPPLTFEVFEFTPVSAAGSEVRVTLGSETLDVFWPQPGSVCRWSMQVEHRQEALPEKERDAFVVLDEVEDRVQRQVIEERIRARAPWFNAGIREIDWRTVVGFQPMMATRFGRGRCWLTGDAGHQASPAGMQSMNVGLRESADLVERLVRILRKAAPSEILLEYDEARRKEWRCLLGASGGLRARPSTQPWVDAQRQRLLPALPGSGAELAALASQLGMDLAEE